MELKGKKVLLMGLGVLGGGMATARFLVEKGADLTVTDMKDETALKLSLDKLKDLKGKIKFVLGEHKERYFLENDIIVINPDVPADNKFVQLARRAGKQIENELTLFYKSCPSKKIVAVTGTRGKTITVNWIAHLLKSRNPDTLVIGNSPDKPFLQEIKKCNENTSIVIEVPSYHLEIVDENNFKPHIAVITNIYRDHINRHKTMEEYALTKSNIFKGQDKNDFLILNKENEWTNFLLAQNPKSKVLFFSEKDLIESKDEFVNQWGMHNLQNFAAASLAALTAGVSPEEIKKQIPSLPPIKFRQEKVFENENLVIYNDTAATSPDATIAALGRFREAGNLILISGGTDRELEFKGWAAAVNLAVKPGNLILLSGSATEKMKKELGWENFREFESLKECLEKALEIAEKENKTQIIFSPGAKSFEKFKNEFDRGEQFNLTLKSLCVNMQKE